MSSVFLLLICAALEAQAPPHRIFVNGVVLTMDAAGRTSQAVAIRGKKIVSVGTSAAIRKLAGPATYVVDLGGRTLLPGLYAAHDHFPGAGHVAVHQVDSQQPADRHTGVHSRRDRSAQTEGAPDARRPVD